MAVDHNSYADRIVAFIDCLGFEQKVIDSANDPKLIAPLRMMNFHFQAGQFAGNQNVDFQTLQFSDTLVISKSASADGLWYLVLWARAKAFNVLHLGMLLRGAVAVGPMIHEGSMAFGPAYLEAYHLESRVALHPRIILSRRAAELAQDAANNPDSWQAEYLRKYLRRDNDGIVYIEIFDNPATDMMFAGLLANVDTRQGYIDLLKNLVGKVENEISRVRTH